ncbi:MAG: hypothetical protein HYZ28_04185 [Myxococcales bacterium]|nr:hypothetical protein [Myxococcales bacterium]
MFRFVFWLMFPSLAASCGVQDAELSSQLREDEAGEWEGAVQSVRGGGGKLVHWQQNIDVHSGRIPVAVSAAVEDKYALQPDLFAIQECGTACVCGEGNVDAAQGRCQGEPLAGSLLQVIRSKSRSDAWDARFARRRDTSGFPFPAQDGYPQTVVFRSDRFQFLKMAEFNGNDVGCSAPPTTRNVAVLLRDGRYTADPSDDRFLIVASFHVLPSHCVLSQLAYYEEAWPRWFGSYTDPATGAQVKVTRPHRFLSGDFNLVSTSSSSESVGRAEENPGCWWEAYSTARSECGGDFGPGMWDAVRALHADGMSPHWTYPNGGTQGCASGWSRCRVDYTFLKWNPTFSPTRLVKATTDSGLSASGARYGDHRAVRTVIEY